MVIGEVEDIQTSFVVRQICKKYLRKGKEVYFAFFELEKVYDRMDRKKPWNVLRLYGAGGKLLKAVSRTKAGMCYVAVAVQSVY